MSGTLLRAVTQTGQARRPNMYNQVLPLQGSRPTRTPDACMPPSTSTQHEDRWQWENYHLPCSSVVITNIWPTACLCLSATLIAGCGTQPNTANETMTRRDVAAPTAHRPTGIDPAVQALWEKNIRAVEATFSGHKTTVREYVAAASFLESTTGITAHDDWDYAGRVPTQKVKTVDIAAWKAWYEVNAPFLVVDEKCGVVRINHDLRREWLWESEQQEQSK